MKNCLTNRVGIRKSFVKLFIGYSNRLLSAECTYVKSHNQYLETIGLFGLYTYAFGFPFSKEICYAGEWMMVGAFVLSLPHIWPMMKSDPIWKAFLILSLFLLFKAILTIVNYSEPVIDVLDAARWRLRFFWIFIVAWWIGGSYKSIHRLLIFSLFGFIILLVIGYDHQLFMNIGNGHRIDFSINAQTFSLLTVSFMLGCTFLAKEFWGVQYRIIRILLWSFAIIVFFELTILSLTRASWIALSGIIIVSCLLSALHYKASIKKNKKKVIVAIFGSLIVSCGIIVINSWAIKQRASSEIADIKEFFLLNYENIDTSSSFGKRFELWKWSLGEIKKYPFLGQKIDNTSKEFIAKNQSVDKEVANYSHVHNSYLEVLLNQGIIGFIIFSFFPLYIIHTTYNLFKDHFISFRYFMFFLSIVLFFAIVNLSEAFFTKWVFWPYFSIIFGCFYSLALWPRIREQ